MKTKLVRIGNSQGIRLPKSLIEECRLEGDVELDVKDGMILIRNPHQPRAGWSDAFAEMHSKGDDQILIDHRIHTAWDDQEWEWK
jgi:antitoxin MazE